MCSNINFKWKGKEVECYNAELSKGNNTFYRSFVINDETFDIGDFAVVNETTKPKYNRIGRILCVYESHEKWHINAKYRGLVRWYSWARDIERKCNPLRIEFDNENEVIEDFRTVDIFISLEDIKRKCRVIYATEEDPVNLIGINKLNRDIYFMCRYKIEKNEVEPIFSESNIAQTNFDEFTMLDLENASNILNITPIKNKTKRKSILQPILLSESEDNSIDKVRSPKNPLKTIKLTPRSKSAKKVNNIITPNRKESVKRNLNESFDNSAPNSQSGTPILNYSIIEQSIDSDKPIKLKLRISDKQKIDIEKNELNNGKSTPMTVAQKILNKQLDFSSDNNDNTHSDTGSIRRSNRATERKSYTDFTSPIKGSLARRGRGKSSDSDLSVVSVTPPKKRDHKTPRKEDVNTPASARKAKRKYVEHSSHNENANKALYLRTPGRRSIARVNYKKMLESHSDSDSDQELKVKTPRRRKSKSNECDEEHYSPKTPQKRNVPKIDYSKFLESPSEYDLESDQDIIGKGKSKHNITESKTGYKDVSDLQKTVEVYTIEKVLDRDVNKFTPTKQEIKSIVVSAKKSILKTSNETSESKKMLNYTGNDNSAKSPKVQLSNLSRNSKVTQNTEMSPPKITIGLKNTETTLKQPQNQRKSILKTNTECNTPKKSVNYISDTEGYTPPKRHRGKSAKNTPKSHSSTTPKGTPKNTHGTRAKLIREGVITPSMQVRNQAVKMNHTPLTKARSQLHVSYVPDALPCREKEFSDIYNFLEGKLLDGCGGCMYISGVPGTGKTATVTEVVKKLQSVKKGLPSFEYVNINGMRLTEPRQSYVEILRQLTGKTMAWEQAQSILEIKFTKERKKASPIILVVDELDILCTKRQDVVYNLLDWPTKASTQLIVITIANTMDLPERLLMGRVTSRLGLTRLTFQAYTHKQLQEIVTKRLIGTDAFNPDAIQLVARKVASVSGDARRALDICRRAAEIAEIEGPQTLVSMKHVNEALNAMITQPKVIAIKRCSRLEQLILQAVVAEVERTGVEETNFLDVCTMLVSIAALDGFKMVSVTVVLAAVSRLGACRLLLTDLKSHDMDQRIILNVSPDDVYYALRKD